MSNATNLLSTVTLFVRFYEMRKFCLAREMECKKCPYYEKDICQKRSTDDILEYCYKVFSEFLDEKD